MKYQFQIACRLVVSAILASAFLAVGASAQMVASHAPTSAAASTSVPPAAARMSYPEATKAVKSGG